MSDLAFLIRKRKFTSDEVLKKILDSYPVPSLVKAMELDDYMPELFASPGFNSST